MNTELPALPPDTLAALEPRQRQALTEFADLIATQYPTTRFRVRLGVDDPDTAYLVAVVDVEDPDVIVDLVIDRLIAWQVEAGVSVGVLPVHTPARTAATRAQVATQARSHTLRLSVTTLLS